MLEQGSATPALDDISQLTSLIASCKGDNPMAAVYVWCASNAAARDVSRQVARCSPIANVHFVDFRRLLRDLVPPALRPHSKQQLSHLRRLELARIVGLQASSAVHNGSGAEVASELVKVFEYLAALDDSQLESLPDTSPVARELVRLFRVFQQLSGHFVDDHSWVDIALANGGATEFPVINFHDVPDSGAAQRLHGGLTNAGRLHNVALSVPTAGDLAFATVDIAANTEVEAELTLAWIRDQARSGVALSRLAVVVPQSDSGVLRGAISSALQRSGIAFNSHQSATQATSATGRYLGACLDAMADAFSRPSLLAWVDRYAALVPSGAVAVAGTWTRYWDQHAIMGDGAALLASGDELDSTGAWRCLIEAGAQARSWREWAEVLTSFLDHLPVSADVEVCRGVIGDLGELELFGGHAVSVNALQATLSLALESRTHESGDPRGVMVGTPTELQWCQFQSVAICGLSDTNYRAKAPSGLVARLQLPGEGRSDGEVGALVRVGAKASSLRLSMSRSGGLSGRGSGSGCLAHPLLVEVVSRRCGEQHSAKRVAHGYPAGASWFSVTPSSTAMLALGPELVSREHLETAYIAGGGHIAYLERAVVANAARYAAGLSAFDGAVGPVPLPETTSVSALERWVRCPRSYFYSQVLGLDSGDDEPDPLRLSGRDRGNLVHEILELYVQKCPPSQLWHSGSVDLLQACIDERFAVWAKRPELPSGLMRQHIKAKLTREIEAVMSSNAELVDSHGLRSGQGDQEVAFGPGKALPGVQVHSATGQQIQLRGRIDRVDRSADGRRAVVIDYKTTMQPGPRLSADAIDGATKLQAFVYGTAVRQAMVNAGEANPAVASGYCHVGGAQREPIQTIEITDEIVEKTNATLSAAATSIEAGLYPSVPGKLSNGDFENCRHCAFTRVCAAPSRRDDDWEQKRHDPVAVQLLPLHQKASA